MSCYICLQDESKDNPFCKTLVCKCKGTNKIHESCLEEVKTKCGNRCTICNSLYTITSKASISYEDYEFDTQVSEVRYIPQPRYEYITHSNYESRSQNPNPLHHVKRITLAQLTQLTKIEVNEDKKCKVM
jgi:hypothetical protein